MNSPEERWWSVRAGEYVLGTLRGEDLALFEKILAHDVAMQKEVSRWEQRLVTLNETTVERSPGEHVWPKILQKISHLDSEQRNDRTDKVQSSTSIPSNNSSNPDVVVPETSARKIQLWPTIAGLATAASLALGVMLLQQLPGRDATFLNVDGLAVVLSDESGEPYYLVETDYGRLRVRVTALTPPVLDEARDFQLWQALPDRSSVRPVALLPEASGSSVVFKVDSLIEGSDLFGVSIEPVGAATDAGPTGPVIAHGDFLPRRIID